MAKKNLLAVILLYLYAMPAMMAQTDQLSYELIIEKISDNKTSLDEKYSLIHSAAHLPVNEQIAVKEKIAEYAARAKDKRMYITLNAMINSHLNSAGKSDSGKIYLDRAREVIDQTSSVDALGAFYYQLGNYYDVKGKEKQAHENYYKAIAYYERSESKKHMLNFLFYKIGSNYFDKDDMQSVSEILPRMLSIEFDEPYKIYYNNIYSFAGSYYEKKARMDNANAVMYLDSSLYYRNKAVETYNLYHETAPNPLTARRMVSQNYWEIAGTYLRLDSTNLTPVIENLRKGEEYMDKNHLSSVARYNLLRVDVYFMQGKYDEAIPVLTETRELVESSNHPALEIPLYNIYDYLAKAYEKKEHYLQAVEFHKKARTLSAEINDRSRYKLIKELNIIHETAEKEAALNNLNNEVQQLKYRRIILTISSLVVIVLLAALSLYLRNKKLKKEKEAAVLLKRVEEDELKYQTLLYEARQRQLRDYLDGLEAERKRLAKELHDNVSNELLSVRLQLLNNDNKEKIIHLLDNLHQEVRNISHGLIPPVFTYVTLPEILRDFAKNHVNSPKTICVVDIQPDDQTWETISSELSLEVYRIIQEAVSNAIKHGKADLIEVELALEGAGRLELTISDNGAGFDPKQSSQGLGLRIIKERATLINGQIQIESAYEKGTTIHLTTKLV